MSSSNLFTHLPLENSTVLLRVDFNVPVDQKGSVLDASRIKAALPTIEYLLEKKCKVVLLSHRGRPKGKFDPALSLDVCVPVLQKLVSVPVHFVRDCIGDTVQNTIRSMQQGEILLLENVRFYAADEDPGSDRSFSKQLAAYADYFVFDAFATAHRLHSSTGGIAAHLPGRSALGFLVEEELQALSLLQNPPRPFYVLLGGAKISTKINLVKALVKIADKVFIGGAMSYTFLLASGNAVGNSLVEPEYIDEAGSIMQGPFRNKFFLPQDHIVAVNTDAQQGIDSNGLSIASGYCGVDIGPKTLAEWKKQMRDVATLFWNGPVGVYENQEFMKGTAELARFFGSLDAEVIVGGGDSAACVHMLGLEDQFAHISTGGGASLELLEKGSLPVIDAIVSQVPAGF